ncbi:MAG: DUF4097 family beta strand repeat-containing protein [Candidatus Aminicenantia bacterium]
MKKLMLFISLSLLSTAFLHSDYTQEIKKKFDGVKIEKINIENVNGSVEVRAWEKSEIYVYVEKKSRNKSTFERTDVIFEESRKELKIKVKKKDGWSFFRGSLANVEIKVNAPAKKILNLTTVNGGINVADMVGELNVETVNGDLSVENHKGPLNSETVNGSINISELSGPLKAETVNGGILVGLREISGDLVINAVNGSIKIKSDTWENVEVRAETVSGSLNIGDFDRPIKRLSLKRRSATFVIGNGNNKVKIETVNGSIRIYSTKKEI